MTELHTQPLSQFLPEHRELGQIWRGVEDSELGREREEICLKLRPLHFCPIVCHDCALSECLWGVCLLAFPVSPLFPWMILWVFFLKNK